MFFVLLKIYVVNGYAIMNNKKIFKYSLLCGLISFLLLTSFNYPNIISNVSSCSSISSFYNSIIIEHSNLRTYSSIDIIINSTPNPLSYTTLIYPNSYQLYSEFKELVKISTNKLIYHIPVNHNYCLSYNCNVIKDDKVTKNSSIFIFQHQQKVLFSNFVTYYKSALDHLVLLNSNIKKFFLSFSKQLYKFFYKKKFMTSDPINSNFHIYQSKKMLVSLFKSVKNNIERAISTVRYLNLLHTFLRYNYFKVIL